MSYGHGSYGEFPYGDAKDAATGIASVVGAGGIASAEAFGLPTVSSRSSVVGAGGIASLETFGQPTVVSRVSIVGAGGIASAEAFGQPTVSSVGGQVAQTGGGRRGPQVRLPYIGPRFDFVAVPRLHQVLEAGGIPSEEAFGLPRVRVRRDARARREEEAILLAA